MKKVLVTGANGQLGQCIQKISEYYANLEFIFKDSKQLDITNAVEVDTLFTKKKFHFCVNCAAYTNVEQAEKTPDMAFKVNAEGAKNIALACNKYKTTLIHISTDYVFDGEKEEPYSVEDATNPINEYGKSKLQGELYIQEILKKHLIIRTSWLYSEFGRNFYKTILDKAISEKILYVTDAQTGCPTNANHLAKHILETINENEMEYGVHHFTDGHAMTWYDFAKKILLDKQLTGKVELFRAIVCNTNIKRPRNSRLT
ncbi:dTDP-4-dehydrorhamnose reductase [Costertonia aggregata]|uniref:dTDP-4-dehydrorhamnose reductase n=1 Tax=Costertonia aggregata TaxID=343403 RepID=A0A7H9AP98_9FLAO|nr:dTDP-4-dehydrorhamnose reductase [Costertonia aggregata]QLG45250.1 dTDP-4-dehydrorhamnose reductase [Costertonia aggregata]